MPGIYVTGDTHGRLDLGKLQDPAVDEMLAGGYLVVAGDWGALWNCCEGGPDEEDLLRWWDERPYTTLVVDGNHEHHGRLDALPVGRWMGGRVHFVGENVIHLMRGEVYEIDGLTLFAMGGAHSHDREWRVRGVTWWEREVPSDAERERAVRNLEGCGWQVDVVVSHAAPSGAVHRHAGACFHPSMVDEYADWLDGVASRLDFKMWYFGHHHMDADLGEYRAVYQDVAEFEKKEAPEIGGLA